MRTPSYPDWAEALLVGFSQLILKRRPQNVAQSPRGQPVRIPLGLPDIQYG